MPQELLQLADQLGKKLQKEKLMLSCAESCTGGWIAEAITSIPGSSQWFERGFVTYSNEAKQEMLGVTKETLRQFGAVSEQTALSMAAGALKNSHAQISVATTGIAGPAGGCAEKPVGLVWFGFASDLFASTALKKNFSGNRLQVRSQAVEFALRELLRLLRQK